MHNQRYLIICLNQRRHVCDIIIIRNNNIRWRRGDGEVYFLATALEAVIDMITVQVLTSFALPVIACLVILAHFFDCEENRFFFNFFFKKKVIAKVRVVPTISISNLRHF